LRMRKKWTSTRARVLWGGKLGGKAFVRTPRDGSRHRHYEGKEPPVRKIDPQRRNKVKGILERNLKNKKKEGE